MRTPTPRKHETRFDDVYFERKAHDLVVADDEIEAWELDSRDLGDFNDLSNDDFGLPQLD